MSTKKLLRLWPTLEALPGLSAVAAEWRERLGPEYDAARGLLQPTSDLASGYPCVGPEGCGGVCRVVEHGPGDIVAVCEDCGTTRKLARADRVVWRLDVDALLKSLAEAMGLAANPARMPDYQTYRVGAFVSAAGRNVPVYLTVQLEPERFLSVSARLVAAASGPIALLAPTRGHFGSAPEDPLYGGKVTFVALEDTIGVDDTGRLAPLQDVAAIFRESLAGPDNLTHVFRKSGEAWEIAFEGDRFHLPDSKGLAYIAFLLSQPHKPLPVAEMVEAVSGEKVATGSTGENYSREAVGEMRSEAADLRKELATAEKNHDVGQQTAIREKLSKIEQHLVSAMGVGGKLRKDTDADRLRKAASKAIKDAFRAIKKHDIELWRHLNNDLKMGSTFSYAPQQHIAWSTV
ncbi:MAG TPA: hypothetical protein PK280_08385 [Planctomycetota bacterium]|nr:hypothetical protein [Planctomycetota bacterium]